MEIIKADAETTARYLRFDRLVDVLDRGFAAGCVVPERHHHAMPKTDQADPTLLLMPAWSHPDDEKQYLGVKIVNVYPDNRLKNLPGLTSTYVLYNGATGEELAILDGNTITGRRTAATSALAARYLSRPQSRKLAVIGSGRVASLMPDAYLAVRPIEEFIIWNVSPAGAHALADSLSSRGLNARVANSVEEAVAEADIVTAATLSTQELIRHEWLRRGAHVDLIGAFAPHMRESDDALMRHAKIYVDTNEALDEAGDLTQPIAAGILAESDIMGNLAELTSKQKTVERDDDDITVFKAVGSGLADLYAAKLVYETITA